MNKIFKKTLVLCIIVLLTATNSLTSLAQSRIQPDVYSPEFPNAYIETGNIMTSADGDTTVTATVYVKEVYQEIDGKQICIDSTLLSKSEVQNIGKENFKNAQITRSSIYPGTSEVKEQLTLRLTIPSQASQNERDLRIYASWNGGSGKYGPAPGDDFVGFIWGGEFDYYAESISGLNATKNPMIFYKADHEPNAGMVWGFKEAAPFMDYLNAFITLKKNKLTGGGNTTSISAKYIHTYQSFAGTISINLSQEGFGIGFALSDCPQQWSLVASLSGIKY